MYPKFDRDAHNGSVSKAFTRVLPYKSMVTLTFDLWPKKSIGFILLPWLTCLQSLIKKHNGLVSILFTSLFPYMSLVTLTFDIQNMVHLLVIVNMSAKFDEESHRRFSFYRVNMVKAWRTHWSSVWWTDRRTEPQQTYYIPSATLCTGLIRELSNWIRGFSYWIGELCNSIRAFSNSFKD